MVIAAVDSGGRCPILELKKGRVASHHRTTLIPHAGHGPNAPHHPTSDATQDVELVRSLPPGDTTPQAGVELFRSPRPVQPVGEVPVVKHAQPSQFTILDDFSDLPDVWVKAVLHID